MRKRVRIVYSGTVQGVGFRFAAERVAWNTKVAGWVRNTPDGTVEVVAEGEEEALISFIDKIKQSMGHYIRGTRINWQDCEDEFDTFSIKFF